MKKIKRIAGVAVLVCLLLAGCSRGKPIEELTMAFGFGVDTAERPGQKKFSIVYPTFSKEAEVKNNVAVSVGVNLQQALLNMAAVSEKDIVLGQIKDILVGEEVARQGQLSHTLDLLTRDPRFPLIAQVVVCEGKAEEILKLKPPANPRIGVFLESTLQATQQKGLIPKTNINDYYIRLSAEGWDPYLPYVVKGIEMPKHVGTALFKDEKLVGRLNQDDSVIMAFLTGESIAARGSYEDPVNPKQEFSVMYDDEKVKVRTTIENGIPVFNIHLKILAELTDIEPETKNLLKAKNIKLYEEALAKQVSRQAQKVIAKLQKLQTDPIGLGAYLKMEHWDYWQSITDKHWKEVYPKAKIKVHTTVQINRFGATTR